MKMKHYHSSKRVSALEACLADEGIVLDDNLIAKESTVNSTTSAKQQNESSNLGNDVDAEKILADAVASDIENAIELLYDSNTVSKVHHDMFENMCVHGIQNHEQPKSIPETYVVNKNNSNIIFDIPNIDPHKDKEEHDYVDDEQKHTFFASLIDNLKCDVEKCTKVNHEAPQANALLTKELERYKKKEKHFAKDMTIESEYYKKIKLLNDEISNLKSQACQNDLLSDHKIISEEELKCEAKKRIKVKQRKSPLSYHGFVYGETQFEELPKVPLKRRDVNLKKAFGTSSTEICFKATINSSFKDNVKRIARIRLSEEFEPLVKDINLQLNCFEKGLVREMKDDLNLCKTSLENENHCLKKTITELSKQAADVKEEMTKRCAQYEKDFAKLEAQCISIEPKFLEKSLTSVQNVHVLSNKSDEAKIKFDTEDLETITSS
ncbi:hypothetical protein Tco_0708822 [Tanacetum coccineum]